MSRIEEAFAFFPIHAVLGFNSLTVYGEMV